MPGVGGAEAFALRAVGWDPEGLPPFTSEDSRIGHLPKSGGAVPRPMRLGPIYPLRRQSYGGLRIAVPPWHASDKRIVGISEKAGMLALGFRPLRPSYLFLGGQEKVTQKKAAPTYGPSLCSGCPCSVVATRAPCEGPSLAHRSFRDIHVAQPFPQRLHSAF